MISRALFCDPSRIPRRAPTARPACAPRPRAVATISRPCRLQRLVARAAVDPPQRSEEGEAAILHLTDSLRLLETERDEAVKTAESCARTAVKLEEMARLLERLAVDKLSEGDETGARAVLQEKVAVGEVLSRTSSRAQTNYSLAAKLAEKIGQQQAELLGLLGSATGSSSSGSGSPKAGRAASGSSGGGGFSQQQRASYASTTTAPAASAAAPSSYASSGYASTASSGRSSGTGSLTSNSSSSGGGGGGYEAPWERSLADARDRIAAAEADAAAAGRRAAWQIGESVEEARERLRSQAWQSVDAARSRLRQSANESIEAARARIAAEDAAVLAQVHELISRYKAGGYVSEEQLDWAFRQLERRSWRQ